MTMHTAPHNGEETRGRPFSLDLGWQRPEKTRFVATGMPFIHLAVTYGTLGDPKTMQPQQKIIGMTSWSWLPTINGQPVPVPNLGKIQDPTEAMVYLEQWAYNQLGILSNLLGGLQLGSMPNSAAELREMLTERGVDLRTSA